MKRSIYFKELAHMTTEADESAGQTGRWQTGRWETQE